jgi:hypothetical protein
MHGYRVTDYILVLFFLECAPALFIRGNCYDNCVILCQFIIFT